MTRQTDRLLRGALLGNATFSSLCGFAFGTFASPLEAAMGLPSVALIAVGIALLPFALGLCLIATRRRVPGRLAAAASAADFAWILGSVPVVAFVPLTSLGVALVAAVAAIVAGFGVLQLIGLRRTVHSSGRGPRTALAMSRVVPVPLERAWEVVSDLDGYADVAPNLAFSRVLNGSGAGLERECGDHDGGRWTETCTAWEEGRRYAFRVHTEADDYPYPFRELEGEWTVEPTLGGGTRVGMRFATSMPGGWIGDLMVATLVGPAFEGVLEQLFDNWEARMRGAA